MRLRGVVGVALALIAVGETGHAQVPVADGSPNRDAMRRLSFMIGEWRGEAWMQQGPERVQTVVTEKVESKLGGVVFVVEGRGVVPGEGQVPDKIVHDAIGVVSFELPRQEFVLRSYLTTGQWGDFTLHLIEGGVQWSRETPAGTIRNTAYIDGDEWHEIGEFSRDGSSWTQIMEMRLRRTG
jgi:hypothetical protein